MNWRKEAWAKNDGIKIYLNSIRFKDEDVFIENSSYARHNLKKRIINQNLINLECSICGNKGIWMNKKLPLILDHINGINNDNRIENLRFLCSNCDSQLSTYKFRRGKKNNAS
jgi:5-methylcytosine-specific restriction endonuclease McrA